MKTLLFIISLYSLSLQAQTLVSGTVADVRGAGIPGANVYLKDTYDGASSDADGHFRFQTEENARQVLVVSAVGFSQYEQSLDLSGTPVVLKITLKESIQKMNGVTVTAAAFGAGHEARAVALQPLDIVTTAGAMGDITGALQTLPGTQKVGEDGRLFIRGGEGYETQVFIDGTRVHTPFGASIPNLPTRGRFSPFLFKGASFSTGGYSAEYGQALSSALILQTLDFPEQNQTDLSVMSVGLDAAHQHLWEKTAVSVKAAYTNLTPYQWLVRQNLAWDKAPQSAGGSVVWRRKMAGSGLLKMYSNYNRSALAVYQPNLDDRQNPTHVRLQNDNLYMNTSYQNLLNKKWMLHSGVSYTYDHNELALDQHPVEQQQQGLHGKAVLTLDASESVAVRIGSEYSYQRFEQTQRLTEPAQTASVEDNIAATFAEADLYASYRWVARTGARLEYSQRTGALAFSPRFSLAYKTDRHSQVSMAYGKFTQTPQPEFLYASPSLSEEKATHYILNYQRMKAGRTLRAEAYHKQYGDLVKTNHVESAPILYDNQGNGYARGIDLFWRDKTLLKNTDFWLSYSLLDTKRNYRNYPYAAVPAFASTHNFSAVYKYFIAPIRTQAGFSYNFASGRPYENPNNPQFHTDRTPTYHDLSVNAAYLIKQNIILYAAASNVLGTEQVFGYQYSRQPNEQGTFARQAVTPPAPRFLFVGLFITLTKDQQENQLDNL